MSISPPKRTLRAHRLAALLLVAALPFGGAQAARELLDEVRAHRGLPARDERLEREVAQQLQRADALAHPAFEEGLGRAPQIEIRVQLAAKAFDVAAMQLLLQHGALPNLPNRNGTTPTMAASGLGSNSIDTRGDYVTPLAGQHSRDALAVMLAASAALAQDPARAERVETWPDGKVTTQQWSWNYKQPREDPPPTTTTTRPVGPVFGAPVDAGLLVYGSPGWQLIDLDTGARLPLFVQARRQGLARGQHYAQAREVHMLEAFVLQQVVDHGRHTCQKRRTMPR